MSKRKLAIVFVIFLFVVTFLIIMLNLLKDTRKVVVNNNNNSITSEAVLSKNDFKASFVQILNGDVLEYDYNNDYYYEGHKINFYSVSGKAKITLDDLVLYEGNNRYLDHLEDYYIIYTKNYTVFKSDDIVLYNSNNKEIFKYDNVISSFKIEDEDTDSQYPFVENNELYFYTCKGNKVGVNKISLSAADKITFVETINVSSCE